MTEACAWDESNEGGGGGKKLKKKGGLCCLLCCFLLHINNIKCCLNTNYRGDGDKVGGGGCLIVD